MSALAGDTDPVQSGGGNGALPGPDAEARVRDLAQAAQWYAILLDENASEEDHAAWRAWLAQSPEHAGAWQHIEAVSRRFDPLRGNGAGSAVAAAAGVAASRRGLVARRRALNRLAGALGLGVAGWLGWRYTPLPRYVATWRADQYTHTGEQRQLVLADGSRVWLNTATAVQVDYGGAVRRLVLLAGEVLVETAADVVEPTPGIDPTPGVDPTPGGRSRPFQVQTRFGGMLALGTRFTVGLAQDQARLDVFEGAVEIRTDGGELRRVDAGQAALFDADVVTPLGAVDRAREAWRLGRLPADDMTLGALLAELGRYRHGHISVAPEVAGLKVMGVYPIDDTDRALAMLEQSLPIRLRRPLPWWTTVEAR